MSRALLLTCRQMAAVDRAAIAGGLPGPVLMEAAGRGVADIVMAHYRRQAVTVLCGPGNNGGDGFVVARHLHAAGWPVQVSLLGDPERLSGDAKHHAGLCPVAAQPLGPDQAARPHLFIDALFGAGLDRPLTGVAAETMERLKEASARIVAVDVPSGLSGDSGAVLGTAAAAEHTVTFCRYKPGHFLLPGRDLCGARHCIDIGIPETCVASVGSQTYANGPELWAGLLKPRSSGSHKYDFGFVLIRGGAEMSGAARLAARAAQAAGAGLVAVAAPAQVLPIYAADDPGLITLRNDSTGAWESLLADPRRNAVLVGPGNGVSQETAAAAKTALATGRAVVLDADALTAFAGQADDLARHASGPLVITPHEGEFKRLFPDLEGDRLRRARAAAKRLGGVVVLKGSDSVIASPDGRAAINDNAPASLARAGSGDVLAGIASAFLARGLPAFEAACAAVHMHGAAAQALQDSHSAQSLATAVGGALSLFPDREPLA